MKQIVFNSFPRSGNVYQGSISRHFFDTMISTVHMPEIFSVKELNNVTIFRKPEDAISSLIMRNSSGSILSQSNINCQEHIELYKQYFNYAEINKTLIYIGKFDDLVNDTVKHFENIAKYFNITLEYNYQDSFENAKLSGKLWDDRYDGHKPRPKDSLRLEIEKNVNAILSIQKLNEEYEDFIKEHATII